MTRALLLILALNAVLPLTIHAYEESEGSERGPILALEENEEEEGLDAVVPVSLEKLMRFFELVRVIKANYR